MRKVKLGPKSGSFYDPQSGFQLAPGEIKELPKGKRSWVLRAALLGGHIVYLEDEEPAKLAPKPPPPPPPTEEELAKAALAKRTEELLEQTRDNIMAKYDFLDDEHLAEAKVKGTKADLVEFLFSIEAEYAD